MKKLFISIACLALNSLYAQHTYTDSYGNNWVREEGI